jgi:hypothetical protein
MKNLTSLHNLKPGTEEYKKVEAELIRQICEVDLGDESRFEIKERTEKWMKGHLKRLESLHKQSS